MTYNIQIALAGLKDLRNLVSPDVRQSKIRDLIRANINFNNSKSGLDLRYWRHYAEQRLENVEKCVFPQGGPRTIM